MKTLVVDDLFENRKLMLNLLSGHGGCDMVSNGEEALNLFFSAIEDDEPYDLVLLDIMMPGMDGHEVLQAMRAKESEHEMMGEDETVIIMITAAHSPRNVLNAFFKGGCTDYIEKPVSRDQLFGKFREYNLI
jgi:two-component system, chemotaxis family, chemotaxis protein CheY